METIKDIIQTCPNCNGKGEVIVRVHNTDRIIVCPICNGTGSNKQKEQ